MITLSYKPKNVIKRLLVSLPDRSRDVVLYRYGLGDDSTRMTLESIGERYGITRERVRQIENHALQLLRKADAYEKEAIAFEELESALRDLGGIVSEEDLLDAVARDRNLQNHVQLLLVLGEKFTKKKEDDEFRHRWYCDYKLADTVHDAIRKVTKAFSKDDLVPESDMINLFSKHLGELDEQYNNEAVALGWLRLSKKLGRNSLGEWGMVSSPNIRAKGMRDLAYLVIRRHGSPMHFTEVAEAIRELFKKEAHVATCHNELIKDSRFVLVGRGLYALAEWGYAGGVVRDVISDILAKHGPLSRTEIVNRVLKERYVKENTVIVNLENPKYFKKDSVGNYLVR